MIQYRMILTGTGETEKRKAFSKEGKRKVRRSTSKELLSCHLDSESPGNLGKSFPFYSILRKKNSGYVLVGLDSNIWLLYLSSIFCYFFQVPGTNYQLDPIRAAFNNGALIRWLDFNDTWLAAEVSLSIPSSFSQKNWSYLLLLL